MNNASTLHSPEPHLRRRGSFAGCAASALGGYRSLTDVNFDGSSNGNPAHPNEDRAVILNSAGQRG
ncbi:hypothetical protein [Novosphingobium soli]|uniref:Uncharacterized protein n=1 Tax=Novosphingobium soli TaxID=574956 RepID=A0ABV6CSG7_9SPHN